MASMTARTGGTTYLNPYSQTGTIRGQEYRRGELISIQDHDHANGGELEAFVFKGLDEAAGIVDVYTIDHWDKGEPVLNQTRSFRTERVATNTELGEQAMAKASEKKERAKAGRTPKVGVCEFSGGETKGGRFLPGKDAALKGALLDGARGGVVDAAAELLVRWPQKATNIEADVLKAAKVKAKEGDAFVEKRTKARLAAVAKGKDPYEASSGLKLEPAA